MIREIYYNLWGNQYSHKRKILQARLGVPYPDRAVIDQEANSQLFIEHLRRITEALRDNATKNIDSSTYLKTRSLWLQNLHSDYITRLNSTSRLTKEQLLQHSEQWVSTTEQTIKGTGNQDLICHSQTTFSSIRKYLASDLSTCPEPLPIDFTTYIYNKAIAAPFLNYLHKNIDPRTGVPAFIYIQASIEAKIIERPPYKITASEFPNIGKRANYDTYIGSARNFRKHQDTLLTIIEEIQTLLK